jgi:hypothetical protein
MNKNDDRVEIVERLVSELNFKRLSYHGLAEKEIKNKVVGLGKYWVHINGIYEDVFNKELGFEIMTFNTKKVSVCLEANLDDDYLTSVEVLETESFDEIVNLISSIEKDPWRIVAIFEEATN